MSLYFQSKVPVPSTVLCRLFYIHTNPWPLLTFSELKYLLISHLTAQRLNSSWAICPGLFDLTYFFSKNIYLHIEQIIMSLCKFNKTPSVRILLKVRYKILRFAEYSRIFPISTQRCFDVHLTSITFIKRWINVQTTSCVNRVPIIKTSWIKDEIKIVKKKQNTRKIKI